MEDDSKQLILENQAILYRNKRSEKYKSDSLTLWLNDEDVKVVEDWAKKNNIGSEKNAGQSPVRDYAIEHGVKNVPILLCKIRHDTEIIDSAGQPLSFDDITEKSLVNVILEPYPYDSAEYGKGISYHILSIMVVKAEPNRCCEAAKKLLDRYNSTSRNNKDAEDEKINLDEVPF